MSEFDFKGALADAPNWNIDDRMETITEWYSDYFLTIRKALRFAARAQNGDVSAGMQCILDMHCSYEYPRKETFKAMTAQLLKEVGDE